MDLIFSLGFTIIFYILIISDVIITHELIHYYVAKKLGYKPKIKLLSRKNPGIHLEINLGNKNGALDFIKISLTPLPVTLLIWMIIPLTININGGWWIAVIMTLMNCSNDLISSFLVWVTWFSKFEKPVNFMKKIAEKEA